MKLYHCISKIIFTVSLIGIVLLIINYFTGIINGNITAGATFICLFLMLIVIIVTSPFKIEKSKK